MRYIVLSIAFLAALTLTGKPCSADHIKVFAEDLPPYAYEEKEEAAGFMVDIVSEILRRLGRDPHMVRLVPWARAMQVLMEQKEVILFPVPGNENYQSANRLIGPVYTTRLNFFCRAGEKGRFTSLEDARKAERISVTRSGYAFETLRGMGFTNLEESNGHHFDFYKLEAGRASLAVMDQTLFPGFLRRHPRLRPTQFQDTGITFATVDMYIAFSNDLAPAMVIRWQNMFDAIKADGTYERILKRYL